jgi:integrase
MTIKEQVLRKLKELSFIYPVLDNIYGKPTFFGVLYKYFFETDGKGHEIGISKRWHEENTFFDYIKFYTDNILGEFPNPDLALEEYTSEDFLSPIDKLSVQKYKKGDETKPYSESYIDKHRLLIRLVYEKALNKGIITSPVLEGTSITQKRASQEEVEVERSKIKKSFSPIEEIAFFDRILKPIREDLKNVDGEEIGLLIMAILGMRNHEIAGLRFRDVLPYQSMPNQHRIMVLMTAMRNSSRLQAGGKSSNAVRSLSLLNELYQILMDRKALIVKHFESKGLMVDVDSLPIACRGKDYQKPCSAGHIGNAGRKHLLALFFSERRLAVIEEVLRKETCESEPILFALGLEEKDPTTYLLRRNAVTRMYHCGLNESEIQFFTGHKIEDIYDDRGDFVNEELLHNIIRKLDRHPICQFIVNGKISHSQPISDRIFLAFNQHEASIKDTSSCIINIEEANHERFLTLVIEEIEPYDKIDIEIFGSNPTTERTSVTSQASLQVSILEMTYTPTHDRTVNIIKTLWRFYYEAYKQYKSKMFDKLSGE